MFELPECVTLVQQMNVTLRGKTIGNGGLGNSPHKFVWYNRKPAEFERLTRGKTVGNAEAKGRWMLLPLGPGYVLVFGECGGRILFHPAGSKLPVKYHLLVQFTDGSALSAVTQMWGAYELYEKGEERERKYIKAMRPTPVDPEFTFDYFATLLDELGSGEKRSAKGLLTQEQLIPGLGNSIAQDILFRARLSPKHSIGDLNKAQRRKLYDAVIRTVGDAVAKGGREDELDLFGKPGGYVRIMSSKTVGRPCPQCGTRVEKIAYLGGACYYCPRCQT